MPTPQTRAQRPRRELRSDAIAEPSSPSRPQKRRKKNDDAPVEPEEENSSLVADQSGVNEEDEDQLVTRVTHHLAAPVDAAQASSDHANSMHESHKEGVQAYAKIAAQDWTYYVKALTVNIGRSSEPAAQKRPDQDGDADPAVHIDLGPSKMISRQHAAVYFNHDVEEWWLVVKGRNSLKVDGTLWKSGQKGPLRSGEVIEIAGTEMMFVLPIDLSPLHIHERYLERAGLAKPGSPSSSRPPRRPLPSSGEAQALQSSPQVKSSRNQGSGPQKTLAPAPPDYKRPGTPPSARSRAAAPQTSPAVEQTPLMMMTGNHDADLSLDENKHMKPQYSYAQMITQAITHTQDEKLNLNGIYNFITSRYSYYRHQPPSGWQNSIRHNLSLNKSFEKVARSTDEPGKGMKWQLVAETREDMIRSAYRGGRGGHRGSSNPSSPSQLNYITQGPRDMAARDSVSARKRKVSPSGSPQPRSAPAIRGSHQTPVRSSRKPLPDEAGTGADGSPLPRLRKNNASSTLGASENNNVPGSPTLTSSYLQEDGASFVTPAPHRVHLKLAPPSTAQRPSQHMPTSSPAPFWKYADIGSTPLKPTQFDLSPSKPHGALPPQSSSPAPARSKSPVASPTRPSRAVVDDPPSPTAEIEEDQGFDLTKGFQSIGSYHAPVGHGKQVQPPATNGDIVT
ncbi:fork head domain-containing protein [Lasiosphaeria miniovina]|uniref:Fork head domain-containing protein n=1 Tax=Lasiosphaeria miniovina TaxID=1954250 RepID=A0AA40AVP0_9PEZI|nr:fork head domain-containing protein [Lasiosphaeria miniovina]KAK0722878.1 fork head domain-containing protein [Lasiosphaeria miniovina]